MPHIEHLSSVCELDGRSALDIGAGSGAMALRLQAAGCRVVAIEIDEAKIAVGRSKSRGAVEFRLGRAERLPIEPNSQDLVSFFFSFHHVPMAVQADAITELIRVLKPGGRVHVVEPDPRGGSFEVVRWIDDETEVRNHAQRVLNQIGKGPAFREVARFEYNLRRVYADFETYVKGAIAVDPLRAERFPAVEAAMRTAFEQAGELEGGKRVLNQPCTAYHFELTGK